MRRLARGLDWLSAKWVLVGLFLLLGGGAAVRMSLLTPPGQVPDEPAHLARAAGLLHGAVLAGRRFANESDSPGPVWMSTVKENPGLAEVGVDGLHRGPDPFHVDFKNPAQMMWLTYSQPLVAVQIDNTAQYFPAAYLPATAGLAVGLALHLPPVHVFRMARFAMLLAYFALGAAAIWIAPGGESVFIAVLLLPISLFLAGSVSEDGVLIALACFSAAALARDPRKHAVSRVAGLAALLVILGAKLPYLPLAGLALLPIGAAGLRARVRHVAWIAAPVVVWAVLVAAFVAEPFVRPAYHPGPLFGGDRGVLFESTSVAANLHVLLARPALFLTLPAALVAATWVELGREMVGVLGLLQLQFPDAFYIKWWWALAFSALGVVFPARRRIAAAPTGPVNLLYVCGIIGLTCWMIIISMYLSWTEIGMASIAGIQGRYFVLLLPFLALAIPRTRWRLPAIIPALPAFLLAAYDVHYLALRVWQNFALTHWGG
jgi:hypothetical protein